MFAKIAAKFVGTFWLVFGGCGSAVLLPASHNWGSGFSACRSRLGSLSSPAPTRSGRFPEVISSCRIRWTSLGGRFPAAHLPSYILAQVAGGIVGAAVI